MSVKRCEECGKLIDNAKMKNHLAEHTGKKESKKSGSWAGLAFLGLLWLLSGDTKTTNDSDFSDID